MAIGGRRSEGMSSNVAILAASIAVAAAVAVVAYQPNLYGGSAPRYAATADPARLSPSCRKAGGTDVVQLAAFLDCWLGDHI